MPLERMPARQDVCQVPRPVPDEPGLFLVDATWGKIQPLELPGGVRTVAELEVLEHVHAGGLVVDTRLPKYVEQGAIPGAVAIPHEEIVEGLRGLDPDGVVVLYCNGPPCTATPQAIAHLLEAGWDPDRLRYYRGGIHDWMTLGLPVS